MKINSIHYHNSIKKGMVQGFPSDCKDPLNSQDKTSAGVCRKQGYKAANSGDLTKKSEVAAISFEANPAKTASSLIKPTKFGNFLNGLNEHNIIGSALMALLFAGIARPATILSMPIPEGKTKEDNFYASGHSVASGIIGFLASLVVTYPLDDALKYLKENPASAGFKKLQEAKDLEKQVKEFGQPIKLATDGVKKSLLEINPKTIKTALEKLDHKAALEKSLKLAKKQFNAADVIAKNIFDWGIAIPRSMITIALIPPILKYVFGIEKGKSSSAPKTPETPVNSTNMAGFIDRKVFAEFKGGLK